MKVRTVGVRTGRTIPHPLRNFANVSTHIELGAEIDDSEDPEVAVNELRIRAEQIVHTHQEQVCESIRRGEEIESTTNRIQKLEQELEELKKRQASHQGLLFGTTEIKDVPFSSHYDDEYDDD